MRAHLDSTEVKAVLSSRFSDPDDAAACLALPATRALSSPALTSQLSTVLEVSLEGSGVPPAL